MISLVDDDAWVRKGLGDLIESLGYKLRTFASAEQFVNAGSIKETSCVITDVCMPGLSGLELQSHLRKEGHSTPLIIITAFPTDEQCALAFADGATCYLGKPVDEKSLIACLSLALAR